MRSLTFTAMLCTLPLCLLAQDQTLTEKADELRKSGELTEAITLYRQVFTDDADNFTNTYNLACAYALLDARDSAFHFLEIALEQDSTVRALQDPDLYYLSSDERWEDMVNRQIEKIQAKYNVYEKPELAKQLWKIGQSDQAFYYHIRIADEEMGRGNPISTALWKSKSMINDRNQEQVVAIVEEHGWPKSSKVGGAAASAAFLVIQHSDMELQKRYLPMIEKACEAGDARWQSYALMYDRIQTSEGKPQRYGSQVRFDPEKEAYEPFPIEQPEQVNKRRAEVGLGPIEDYLARWDIEWAVPQE